MMQILLGVLFALLATEGIAADADFDGVDDAVDNCPFAANADQADTDDDGIGDVCIACGMLDAAGEFGIAVTTTLTAKAGRYDGRVPDMEIVSDVCADRVILEAAEVGDPSDAFAVFAPRASGQAVKLRDGTDEFGSHPARVWSTVATGGGSVSAPPGTVGVVDTSGAHPRLARCQESAGDAAAASAAFAALPANETHLDIDLGPGDEITLDAGTPGAATIGVVNVRSLRVRGEPDKVFGGCQFNASVDIRGPRSTIVNVTGKIELGPCAVVGFDTNSDVIINAVGKGTVRMGPQIELFTGLLAPQRNVLVKRANNYSEAPNRIGPVWARKLAMAGYTQQSADLNGQWVCGYPQDLP